MRMLSGTLIFAIGITLGFAWTRRPLPTDEPTRTAVLEVFLAPTSGTWDDGENHSPTSSGEGPGVRQDATVPEDMAAGNAGAARIQLALSFSTQPAQIAELIGPDLAEGKPGTVRALVDALAELPWEKSAGVYRAVVFDPLLDLSLRVYGVEGLSRAGAAATPLLRDLLAREEDREMRAAIEQRLAADSGASGTGAQ